MSFVSHFRRGRSAAGDAAGPSSEPGSSAPAQAPMPFPGYDRMDEREVIDSLCDHSQAELAAVDAYERSHKAREPIFNKLHYLRRPEPVAGYDDLSAAQINAVVESADLDTLNRVRSYEQKFANRPAILDPVIAAQRVQRADQPSKPVPQYQPLSARADSGTGSNERSESA